MWKIKGFGIYRAQQGVKFWSLPLKWLVTLTTVLGYRAAYDEVNVDVECHWQVIECLRERAETLTCMTSSSENTTHCNRTLTAWTRTPDERSVRAYVHNTSHYRPVVEVQQQHNIYLGNATRLPERAQAHQSWPPKSQIRKMQYMHRKTYRTEICWNEANMKQTYSKYVHEVWSKCASCLLYRVNGILRGKF